LFTVFSILAPIQNVFAASRGSGTLIVNSSPYEKGAKIVIDGEVKGVVPGKIELPAGNYVVTIVGKKYSGKKTVSIASGESKRTTIALTYKTDQEGSGFFMKLFQFILGAGIIYALFKFVQDEEAKKEAQAN
jgi:hypothetical protein